MFIVIEHYFFSVTRSQPDSNLFENQDVYVDYIKKGGLAQNIVCDEEENTVSFSVLQPDGTLMNFTSSLHPVTGYIGNPKFTTSDIIVPKTLHDIDEISMALATVFITWKKIDIIEFVRALAGSPVADMLRKRLSDRGYYSVLRDGSRDELYKHGLSVQQIFVRVRRNFSDPMYVNAWIDQKEVVSANESVQHAVEHYRRFVQVVGEIVDTISNGRYE